MHKVRYELDPYNRLVLVPSGRKSSVNKGRIALEGNFVVDKNNNLSYRIKSPVISDNSFSRDYIPAGIPNQVKIKGRWSLTDQHKLSFSIDRESKSLFREDITIAGELVDMKNDSLLFAITTKYSDGSKTYLLDLTGAWNGEGKNGISFRVRRESGRHDVILFKGEWRFSKAHQIVYEYEKAVLIRKTTIRRRIVLKGYWDISDPFKISYMADLSTKDRKPYFDLSIKSAYLKSDHIKFELILGSRYEILSGIKNLRLSGAWNFSKAYGVNFETEYEDGKFYRISFGAEIITKDDKFLSCNLRVSGKDVGVGIKLSKKYPRGDGEIFARLSFFGTDNEIAVGGIYRW